MSDYNATLQMQRQRYEWNALEARGGGRGKRLTWHKRWIYYRKGTRSNTHTCVYMWTRRDVYIIDKSIYGIYITSKAVSVLRPKYKEVPGLGEQVPRDLALEYPHHFSVSLLTILCPWRHYLSLLSRMPFPWPRMPFLAEHFPRTQ